VFVASAFCSQLATSPGDNRRVPDKTALEERVAELAEEHSGREFVAAVGALAESLDAQDRALLEQILLERSTDSFRDAIAERVEAQSWLRRQLAKIESPRPPKS
jgi:hypothetical protein